ncbi:hypothetical protein D3C75_660540 [compost metagenome]
MLAKGQAMLQRSGPVQIKAFLFRADTRLFIGRLLTRCQYTGLQITHLFFENR